MALLLSSGVYAYTTRAPLALGAQNTPQPLDEEQGIANQQGENEGPPLMFLLSPVGSTAGTGEAEIHIRGNTLEAQIEVEKLGPSTTLGVVLVATPVSTTTSTTTTTSASTTPASCTGPIETIVTNAEGEAEAELSTTLSSGTYEIGLVLCSSDTPVLVSDPATRTATLPQGQEEKEPEETEQSTISTVTESEQDDEEIKSAETSETIPDVVSVSNTGLSVQQLDPRFSVSESRPDKNHLLISISAKNVTGPRDLLVDLKGSQWTTSSLQSLKVRLDGQPISRAASISQVLTTSPSGPASYVILGTSTGLKLLVSIPHFSLHAIQVITSAASAVSFLVTNGAILLAGALVVTALLVAVYLKRRRFFAPVA